MKRIISVLLLSLFVIIAVAFNVSAASDFGIYVTGKEVVNEGETLEYVVTVNKVSFEGGLIGFDIELSYDPDFFTLESVVGKAPETWNADFDSTEIGKVYLYPAEEDGDAANSISGDGKVSYTLTFKVLDEPKTDNTVIKVVSASGNTPDFDSTENGTLGEVNVVLQKQLSSPTDLTFIDGVASWEKVENAKDYSVQLYKDGKKIGGATTVAGDSKDFSDVIKKNLGGAYTFTVKANPKSEAFSASTVVECAEPYNYRGALSKPTIAVMTDRIKGSVTYVISDDNIDGVVGSYIIRVYESGKEEHLYEIAGITEKGSGTITKPLAGGNSYDFTVEAISADNNPDTGNASSGESSRANINYDTIIGIAVTGMPLLEYIEGDTLNLSSLVVTVTFASGDETPVSLKDFEKYGIVTSMKHNADLTLSMDGRKIIVTLGSYTAEQEITIVVESGECKHEGATTDEYLEPTCGAPGYNQTVCNICGAAIIKTEIPATGNHEFSDWEWLFKPTETIDGMRYHKCKMCGFDQTEKMSYDEYMASQTNPPVTTDPPVITTTPEESTGVETTTKPQAENYLGGLGNIGKIFLYVLIAIFAIIVLFIIIAIWAESRRSRRRRSHRRANRSSSARANYNNTNRRR